MRQIPGDFELSARMFLTMFLLAALYLVFALVLFNAGVSFTWMLVIVGAMLLMQYYFSDRMVLLSTGAKVISPEQAPELHAMVYRLAAQAGVPKPKVAVVPSPAPNAFATGRSPGHAVVAVTQGLLDRLNPQEIEAVLAHEMSHVRNHDMVVMTLATFFATVASFLMRSLFFFGGGLGGGYGRDRENRNGGGIVLVYLVSLLVWVVSFFLIRALSRYREYAADRGSAYLTGAPANLRSALIKISNTQLALQPALGQADAVNAFLIVPSLKGLGGFLAELSSTHPSLKHRLAYLEELERQIQTK
ncbi:MAG: zinc metalloprotease HtpX [Thermacetogeniaceae bacterium]